MLDLSSSLQKIRIQLSMIQAVADLVGKIIVDVLGYVVADVVAAVKVEVVEEL